MEQVKTGGTYQHFKNKKIYKVIGIAKHSETMEDMVIYEPQYESKAAYWVRPLPMFTEEVEYEGVIQPRFKLIS